MDKSKTGQVRSGGSFTTEERHQIIKEYLSGHTSKIAVWQKHTGQIEERGQLLRWMRQLGYISYDTLLENRKRIHNLAVYSLLKVKPENTNSDRNPAKLEQRIKELEQLLETAQLQAEGYKLMIEIAEKELKIPIKKKSNTK